MRELAKKVARTVLGEYSAYCIYSQSTGAESRVPPRDAGLRVVPVDRTAIQSSEDELIREQAAYAGHGSHAYACLEDNRIVGVCFYWFGERYRQRNFWPLAEREAKLVQIVTIPQMRGRGVARLLIASSFRDLIRQGFDAAYARVWHSNGPAKHAFEQAGWTRVALVVEINPLRRSRPIRIVRPARPARRTADARANRR